jgi:hypothetical protein
MKRKADGRKQKAEGSAFGRSPTVREGLEIVEGRPNQSKHHARKMKNEK